MKIDYEKEQFLEQRETNYILWLNTIFTIIAGGGALILARVVTDIAGSYAGFLPEEPSGPNVVDNRGFPPRASRMQTECSSE